MRSTRHKRKKQLLEARRRRGQKQRQSRGIQPDAVGPSDAPPLLNAIRHVAAPLFERYGEDPKYLQTIADLVTAAWNMTLLPPKERERQIQKCVERVFGEEGETDLEMVAIVRGMCDVVVERKEKFYPNIKQLIVNLEVRPDGENGFCFEVAYREFLGTHK